PGAAQSAAQVLASHAGVTLPAGIPGIAADFPQPAEVDPGQPGAPVRLSGLQSRFASTYKWEFTSNPGNAVLVGDNTAEPGFLANVSGNYGVKLTVTDTSGNSSTLTRSVVADAKPRAQNFPVSANSGDSVVIVFSSNGVTLGDGNNTLTVSNNLPGTTLG